VEVAEAARAVEATAEAEHSEALEVVMEALATAEADSGSVEEAAWDSAEGVSAEEDWDSAAAAVAKYIADSFRLSRTIPILFQRPPECKSPTALDQLGTRYMVQTNSLARLH